MSKNQSEYPMVERYLKMMPMFEREHNKFRCQLNAIINYLEQCRIASEDLRIALGKCIESSDNNELA
jgi:hypothetical protein